MRPHRVEDRRQVHGSVGRGIWLLVGLAGALAYVSKGSGSPLRTPQDSMAPFAFSAPAGSGYAGASACASCHRAIYEKFRRTGMGRSMAPVTSAQLQTVGASASIRDEKMERHFEVYARDGKLYQSQYQTSSDGKEIFRETHQIEWIIGAGANGLGAVVKNGDYLFQAPLSFYSRPKTWALSPGYEYGNYGFNRPILAGCIFCHSGQPRPVPDSNGRFENPPFSEVAIGCENCHGPGLSHVVSMHTNPNYEGHDPSIINPARLSSALADNICMACHQTGDVRVLQPGKDYRDFRAGTPLDDTLSILMVPPKRESPPKSDLLEHYYSMTLSKCYRESHERLRCVTCHDAHDEPSHEEAPAYFAKKCLTCHTNKSCKLALNVRLQKKPPNDCAGCHMPKRDVQEISHSSLTNHRILSRSGEPFPDIAFHQTTSALPDLIHLNPAPDRKGIPPPPLVLLQAYGELMDQHPEYAERYASILNELEQTQQGSALVQAAVGRRELRSGKPENAAKHLERALEIGPPRATTYADLAEALDGLGRKDEAVPLLAKAIEIDPFNPMLQKTLVLRYIQLKQYSAAEAAMEHYLETFPQDSFMRDMLARAKSGKPNQ